MKKKLFLLIQTDAAGVKGIWAFKAFDRRQVVAYLVENAENYYSFFDQIGYNIDEFETPTALELLQIIEDTADDDEINSVFEFVKMEGRDIEDVEEMDY